MATRVRLSIISTTSRPVSRNHSAIRVATNAARSRTTGGCVRGGHHDHRAGQALGAEVVLEELAHLAATLADQGDHRDLGLGAAGDHREQAWTCRRRSRRRCRPAGRGRRARACRAPGRRGRPGGRPGRARAGAGRCSPPRPAAGRAARGRRRSGGRGRRARGRCSSAPTCTRSGPPVEVTRAPTRRPCVEPSGRQTAPAVVLATASAGTGPPSPSTSTTSPIATSTPRTSRCRPRSSVSRPDRRGRAASRTRSIRVSSTRPVIGPAPRAPGRGRRPGRRRPSRPRSRRPRPRGRPGRRSPG